MTTENDNQPASIEDTVAAAIDGLEDGTVTAPPEVQPETVPNAAAPAVEAEKHATPATEQKPAEAAPEAPAGKPEATKPETAAEGAQQPAQPSAPEDVAPSSWKPEVAAKWGGLSAEVKAEINRRETEYHKGIEQYKPYATLGQEYERVLSPNMDMIRQAGVQPAAALEHLFNAHRTLTYGTPDQKRDAIARIARDCNIDLNGLTPAAPVDPQVQRLMAERQQLQQFQHDTLQQQNQAVLSEIQAFAQAPGHEHFEAVKQDMGTMLQSGMAQSLDEAYSKAVWARPELRQSLVEKERTEAEKRATEQTQRSKAKSAAVGVKGSPPNSNGALPTNASIEETVAAAMDGLIS